MNIKLVIQYDGTAYHGWQEQKNAVTVSETLSDAVSAAVGEKINLIGCGRTDAGVHARTYVANFRSDCAIPLERLPYAINTRLPLDISVSRAVEVPYDFHATFSNIEKEYTYLIRPGRIHDPFSVNRAHFYPRTPNIELMREAAARIVGEHDFAALRSVGSNVKTTVRTVYRCDVRENGEFIEICVAANGFLYNMARAIAGTILYASEGKLTPDDISELLISGERQDAGPTLPACGLYMTGVKYADPNI